MEENKLRFVERIKQLAKEGQTIEVELRDKEDSLRLGKVVFVGDDYIEFVREVKSETTQEGSDDNVIIIQNVRTILSLEDIRAFSILEEGAVVRQIPPAEGNKK